MRRLMSLVAGALALVGIAGGMTACTPTINCSDLKSRFADSKATTISVDDAAKTVFCLTNDQRTSNGLAAYTWNDKLATAAKKHADAAVAIKWWHDGADPHVNPQTGSTPTSRVRGEGYCSSGSWSIGENVYWAWGDPISFAKTTPRDAVTWWMNSPGHRANILSTTFKELGVGVAKGAPEPGDRPNAAVFVQDFGACI
jgi:uncharacterized protein YkwD